MISEKNGKRLSKSVGAISMTVRRGLVARLFAAIFCMIIAQVTWPAAEWSSVGGDPGNTRFSPLGQINLSNVKSLRGVWETDLGSPSRTPPVVADGILYITDASTIYAIGAQSGAIIWKFRPDGASPSRGGVSLGPGLLFCGLSDAHVIALDIKSGKLVWTGFIGYNQPTADAGPRIQWPGPVPAFNAKVGTITSAPLYVNGVVITGLSGGDSGARGSVAAIDARTGKLVWRFFVVPTPGSPGAESWPKSGDALEHGGGAVWSHGAADPELGLVYFGTGNAVPQLGGETRPGDNLYVASVVALDFKTGQLRWYFQLTHHDLWEMDVSTPVVLYTDRELGRARKALAVARTDGYLFLLDRASGKPIHAIDERPVKQDIRLKTAATQPFPRGAERFGPECVPADTAASGFILGCWFDPLFSDKQNVLMPHITMRQAPMSFDPETGYFYVMGQVTPTWYGRTEDPYSLIMGRPPGASEYGLYAAIDSHTEKIVWQKRSPWGLSGGSGALTTAGGLLFHMEADGNFQADDARTGTFLWRFQTGSVPLAGVVNLAGGVPAASYEIDGRQYIALLSNRSLWAFALNGSLAERAAPPAPSRVVRFAGPVRQLPADGSGEITLGTGQAFVSEVEAKAEPAKQDYGFSPGRARVKPGGKVTFINGGITTHTIIADDRSWATGPIKPGQSAAIIVEKAGTYAYWADDSPFEKGQLIVQDAAESVFSHVQTVRGAQLYSAYCSSCHGVDLTGATGAPELAGDSFLQRWQLKSVADLLTLLSTTMPKQSPHSLTDQNYTDIVAFLMDSNGFPPGPVERPTDTNALSKILFSN